MARRIPQPATLDRLGHDAYRVVLDGNSYRAPKPMPDTKTKQKR